MKKKHIEDDKCLKEDDSRRMLSICAAFPGLIGRKFHCATEFILMFELQKAAEPIDHLPDNLH